MGKNHLEHITCPICMDSLFTRKDEFGDKIPIATSECGHVFHEPCILEWFKAQAERYLASAREQGMNGRYASPTISDAPAICPSCRTECFANPETGQPMLYRLFIDLDSNSQNDNSSMIGSSPILSSRTIRKSNEEEQREKEVLNLARRAKNLTEEVKSLNADSIDEDMDGMTRRSETLVNDMVNVKTLTTVKTHIDNLKTEIFRLHSTLTSHPLIPTLREQVAERDEQLKELHDHYHRTIRRETKRIKEEEQAKCEVKVRKALDDKTTILREYEVEKVKRKTGFRNYEDKVADLKRRLAQSIEQLEKEKEDRKSKEATLHDRNKQLKLQQKRLEDRKLLQDQVTLLQAENDRLKSSRDQSSSFRDSAVSDEENVDGDTSILEISSSNFPRSSHAGPSRHKSYKQEEEDSLQIEFPSFHDDSYTSSARLPPPRTTMKELDTAGFDDNGNSDYSPTKKVKASTSRGRMHPTARTISVDVNHEKKREKTRTSSSKYFPYEGKENNQDTTSFKTRSDDSSPLKKSKTNPFPTTKESNARRNQLPSTVLAQSTNSSSDHNRKPATNEDNKSKDNDGMNMDNRFIIDLADSSPETSPKKSIRVYGSSSKKENENQRSMVDILGLADKHGRPTKSVANGHQKLKRRMV
ncbi:uncharacterized protein L201_006137 [Kwoniella dendrophila CBS 6074]|uniref:RING-type domain-containing protein n=1 Tax=Kwoniella dendrophila CBS 6074 TaxID=1295534 RepID=A0AAX4K0N1_9TREE